MSNNFTKLSMMVLLCLNLVTISGNAQGQIKGKDIIKYLSINSQNSLQSKIGSNKGKIISDYRINTSSNNVIQLNANVIYRKSWALLGKSAPFGIYRFFNTDEKRLIFQDKRLNSNGGAIIKDGILSFINITTAEYEHLEAKYYEIDTNSWEETSHSNIPINSYEFISMASAIDPISGIIYGSFFKKDLSGFEFGTIDYKYLHRKTILKDAPQYVALAFDENGILYGIDKDSSFYQINKKNGQRRLITKFKVHVSPYRQAATYDPSTKRIFWAAMNPDITSTLYEINPLNGEIIKLGNFKDDDEISLLNIVPVSEKKGQPASISNISTYFSGPSLTGKIRFTLPSKNVDGQSLRKKISYVISSNQNKILDGYGNPGETIEQSITLPPQNNRLSLVAISNGIYSEPSIQEIWVGYDEPEKIKNLTITNNENNIILDWESPEKGTHGGFFDKEDIKYKIIRMPENKIVANKLSATTFKEVLNNEILVPIYYQVYALNKEVQSESVKSKTLAVGKYKTTPFTETFDDENTFVLFNIIDINKDKTTWELNKKDKCVDYFTNKDNKADDWLITPSLRLKKDTEYHLSFNVKGKYSKYKELLQVAIGQNLNIKEFKSISDILEISNTTFNKVEMVFDVKKNGDYQIGFHALSEPNKWVMSIDDINVIEGANFKAPDKVKHLKITPNKQGKCLAKIRFTTPSTDLLGNKISDIKSATIKRDGKLVQTITNIRANHEYEINDIDAHNGINTYSIYVTNKYGNGRIETNEAFIGIDIPKGPKNIIAKDNFDGSFNLSWTVPEKTGKHDLFVDTQNILYNIYAFTNKEDGMLIAKGINETSYKVDNLPQISDQSFVVFQVKAETIGGEGDGSYSNLSMFGNNYTLPFKESFTEGIFDHLSWVVTKQGTSHWKTTKMVAADKDKGSVIFSGSKGESSRLSSGKIYIDKNIKHPTLKFKYYALKTDAMLEIEIAKDGGNRTIIGTIDFNKETALGWTEYKVDLSKYIGYHYNIISFNAKLMSSKQSIMIDQIFVYDYYPNDLGITLDIPSRLIAGKNFKANVTIENYGDNIMEESQLCVFIDNILTDKKSISPLNKEEIKTQKISARMPINKDKSRVKIVLTNDQDENVSNNIVEKEIILVKSNFPTIQDLTIKYNGIIPQLEWSVPIVEHHRTIEKFESYDSFSIDDIGDWTLLDKDKAETFKIKGLDYNNAGKPFALYGFQLGKAQF